MHTVNEHLRSARRKTGATSSREAARLSVTNGHENVGSEPIGVPEDARTTQEGVAPSIAVPAGRPVVSLYWAGAAVIGTAIIAAVVTSAIVQQPEPRRAQVESTFPAQGKVVAPGAFELRVTFDRPMQRGSYSFVQTRRESWPDCAGVPRQSANGRSFSLTCRAAAGRAYEVLFNRAPYLNFKDVQGQAAEPYRLVFRAR